MFVEKAPYAILATPSNSFIRGRQNRHPRYFIGVMQMLLDKKKRVSQTTLNLSVEDREILDALPAMIRSARGDEFAEERVINNTALMQAGIRLLKKLCETGRVTLKDL